MKQADPHFIRLAELMEVQEEQGLRRDEQWQQTLLQAIQTLKPASKEAVKPIGKSCENVKFGPDALNLTTEIDEPTADVIRTSQELELSDMHEMTLNVDGYTHHNKKLKVAHPTIEGRFINADIRDPAIDIKPNAYTDAASTKSNIKVLAKIATSPDNEIQRIYIMEMI